MSSARLLEFSNGIAKEQMEKKALLSCIFLPLNSKVPLPPPHPFPATAPPPKFFLKVLWHFRAQYAPWGIGPGLKLTPPPPLLGGPGPVLGESPSNCLGSWPSGLGWMKSVSMGVRVSSLRAPRGSPPASALPLTHRVGAQAVPGSCGCSCAAAPSWNV